MTPIARVARQPTWLLSRANARSQKLLAEAFTAAGSRGYHFRVLAALEQHGPTSQANLGRQTGIDPSDVVATLTDLTAGNLAERSLDPGDRRRNIVTITPAGLAELERLSAVLAGVQEAVLAPLTPAERATFLRLVTKLG